MRGKEKKGFNIRRKRTLLFLCLIASCLVAVSAYGRTQASLVVKNTLSMGAVEIRLEEFSREESFSESAYEGNRTVVPGQTVSKIPRITCLAAPCYVRAKIVWNTGEEKESGGEEERVLLSEEALQGMKRDWKRCGDYYYYTKALQRGEAVDLFEGVTFPSSLRRQFPAGPCRWRLMWRPYRRPILNRILLPRILGTDAVS